jgi:hypothetical protein
MFCPDCGEENKNNAKYCQRCGCKFDEKYRALNLVEWGVILFIIIFSAGIFILYQNHQHSLGF